MLWNSLLRLMVTAEQPQRGAGRARAESKGIDARGLTCIPLLDGQAERTHAEPEHYYHQFIATRPTERSERTRRLTWRCCDCQRDSTGVSAALPACALPAREAFGRFLGSDLSQDDGPFSTASPRTFRRNWSDRTDQLRFVDPFSMGESTANGCSRGWPAGLPASLKGSGSKKMALKQGRVGSRGTQLAKPMGCSRPYRRKGTTSTESALYLEPRDLQGAFNGSQMEGRAAEHVTTPRLPLDRGTRPDGVEERSGLNIATRRPRTQ